MPVGQIQNWFGLGNRNNLGTDSAGNLVFKPPGKTARFISLLGSAQSTTGLISAAQSILTAKNADGTTLAANGNQVAGNFGILSTPGAALRLISETANANTKTDAFIIEANVGNGYVSGQAVPVTIGAQMNAADANNGAKTLAISAWLVNNDGSQTAVAVTAPANVNLTTATTDYVFSLAAANLAAAARLVIRVTASINQGAATANFLQVNSIRVG